MCCLCIYSIFFPFHLCSLHVKNVRMAGLNFLVRLRAIVLFVIQKRVPITLLSSVRLVNINISVRLIDFSSLQTDLLSVESLPEHLFIQEWLNTNDPSTQRWITSGRRNGPVWQWAKQTGPINLQYDQGWLPNTEQEQRLRSFLVYGYQSNVVSMRLSFFSPFTFFFDSGTEWGWLPYDFGPTEISPFVCEVPIRDTYGVMTNFRSIGTTSRNRTMISSV